MTNPVEDNLSLAERAVHLSEEVSRQSRAMTDTGHSMSAEIIRLNKELLRRCEELLDEMSRVRGKIRKDDDGQDRSGGPRRSPGNAH